MTYRRKCPFCPVVLTITKNNFNPDSFPGAITQHYRLDHPKEYERIKEGLKELRYREYRDKTDMAEVRPSQRRFPKLHYE